MIHTDIYLELVDDTNGITDLVPAKNIDIAKATGNPRLAVYQSGIEKARNGTTMMGSLNWSSPVMRFAAYSTDFSEAYAICEAIKDLFDRQANVTVGTLTVAKIELDNEGDLEAIAPQDGSEEFLMGRFVELIFEITE